MYFCLSLGMLERGKGESETDDVVFLATVVHGHVTALPGIITVGKELTHEVFEGKTPLLEDACFPVLGEDNILAA